MDLWPALAAEMGRVRVGLLGVQGSALPLCPMVHLVAADLAALWFLAEVDTDLVKAVAEDGACGVYGFTGLRHDLYACLTGPIRCVPDRQGLETVWSEEAEAQFPGGLGDIERMPLRLELREASLWQGSGLSAGAAIRAAHAGEKGEEGDGPAKRAIPRRFSPLG